MAVSIRPTLFLYLVISLFLRSSAQTCSSYSFSKNRLYSTCNSLPVLSASIHWTYNAAAGTVDIAYRASQSSDGWIAWGINPTGSRMAGTQALVAHQNTSGGMTAYTTPIADTSPSMRPGKLSFDVTGLEGEYSGNVMTIYATVTLPNNRTTVDQVWQASTVSNGQPQPHALSGPNGQSYGSLNLLSGESSTAGNSLLRRKNTHGILNAVSWGILMPIGAIIARYLKVFKSADPAWFYLHVAIQCSAYIVGVAGWGTGLKLGSDSVGITYDSHRNIGISLFCLATLQVFALLLRPKKDHKFRLYWNIYHHSVGYTVIILSVVNVFKGLDILDPSETWKNAYIGIIATLGGIAVVLEAITWVIVLKRRRSGSSEKPNINANRVNSTNGHGGWQHQAV